MPGAHRMSGLRSEGGRRRRGPQSSDVWMVLGDPLHRPRVMERKREAWLPNLWEQIPVKSESRQNGSQAPYPHTPIVRGQQ